MIRYANGDDLVQIRKLWDICFPDDTGFNDYFFEHLFDLDHVLLMEIDGQIAAMTHMIPRVMRISADTTEVCTYIYGACTHPEHRRKHLMSALLERTFILDCSLGRASSILIPAEPWLFDFYHLFGYRPIFCLNTVEINIPDHVTSKLSMLNFDDIDQMNKVYESNFCEQQMYLIRDRQEWKRQIEMFRMLGLGCFGKYAPDGTLQGYAFAWRSTDDCVYVQEIAAGSPDVKQAILEEIAAAGNVKKARYSDIIPSSTRFGCMKRYDDQEISSAYMNLMMN